MSLFDPRRSSKRKMTFAEWNQLWDTLNSASIDSRNAMSILRSLLDHLGLTYEYCGENFHVTKPKGHK